MPIISLKPGRDVITQDMLTHHIYQIDGC